MPTSLRHFDADSRSFICDVITTSTGRHHQFLRSKMADDVEETPLDHLAETIGAKDILSNKQQHDEEKGRRKSGIKHLLKHLISPTYNYNKDEDEGFVFFVC